MMWTQDRRAKKHNKEPSMRFDRSDDLRRHRKAWDNSLVWKRDRKNRVKMEMTE